jgi:cytochrome c5
MKKIILLLFIVIASSCSTKKVIKNNNESTVNEVVETKVVIDKKEGQLLYENNCAKCHDLPKTSDFSAQEWLPIMTRMQKKAKISDAESDKIYNYIIQN